MESVIFPAAQQELRPPENHPSGNKQKPWQQARGALGPLQGFNAIEAFRIGISLELAQHFPIRPTTQSLVCSGVVNVFAEKSYGAIRQQKLGSSHVGRSKSQ